MKQLLILTFFTILFLAACGQTPSTLPTPEPQGFITCTAEQKANQACTLEYNPVCGRDNEGNQKTFGNACGACAAGVEGYVSGACAGDEVETYTTCDESQRNVVCTKEYDPVCADVDNGIRCITTPCPSSDKMTYGNACSACADSNVFGYAPGACPNAAEVPEKCAEGYVQYVTQTGFACSRIYTENVIKAWPQCTRESQCKEMKCVYALVNMDKTEINWNSADDARGFPKGSLRCVPADYEDMLLQSSGLTGIDANGEMYAVIA